MVPEHFKRASHRIGWACFAALCLVGAGIAVSRPFLYPKELWAYGAVLFCIPCLFEAAHAIAVAVTGDAGYMEFERKRQLPWNPTELVAHFKNLR